MEALTLYMLLISEAATRAVLQENMFLEISQNSQENTCSRVSFLINFIKKETLAQVIFCGFCEISKNIFFIEHLWTTASVILMAVNIVLFELK